MEGAGEQLGKVEGAAAGGLGDLGAATEAVGQDQGVGGGGAHGRDDAAEDVGVALQAYLHRTEQDVRRMNELGARVRLVKGAYKEPASVAFQKKSEVDAAAMERMAEAERGDALAQA